jgi:hypothetical protein
VDSASPHPKTLKELTFTFISSYSFTFSQNYLYQKEELALPVEFQRQKIAPLHFKYNVSPCPRLNFSSISLSFKGLILNNTLQKFYICFSSL